METADTIYKKHFDMNYQREYDEMKSANPEATEVVLDAMKDYARQVAIQVRKACGKKVFVRDLHESLSSSIENVNIEDFIK